MTTKISDHERQYYISSERYLFERTAGDDMLLSEGYISFVTEHGFFAALGHNEDAQSPSYEEAELFEISSTGKELFQAGRVLKSCTSGVYGAFYDDYPVRYQRKIDLQRELCVGSPAELWFFPTPKHPIVYEGEIVAVFPEKPHEVLFQVKDKTFSGASFGFSGSIVVQQNKLVAVVAGANEYPATLLYCTSARQMEIDLLNMIYDLSQDESV